MQTLNAAYLFQRGHSRRYCSKRGQYSTGADTMAAAKTDRIGKTGIGSAAAAMAVGSLYCGRQDFSVAAVDN